MKIVVIDYDIGNVKSIINAFKFNNCDVLLSREKNEILSADGLILPGVGAFSQGMANLKKYNLDIIIKEYSDLNKPLLGICLGMQMLMEESEEFGLNKGIGLFKGNVIKIPVNNTNVKLPHISWAELKKSTINWSDSILNNIKENSQMYFVHSFVVNPKNDFEILSKTIYNGTEFCSSLKKGKIFGCQFHPEKSGKIGLNIINNFINLCK